MLACDVLAQIATRSIEFSMLRLSCSDICGITARSLITKPALRCLFPWLSGMCAGPRRSEHMAKAHVLPAPNR